MFCIGKYSSKHIVLKAITDTSLWYQKDHVTLPTEEMEKTKYPT